MAFSLSHMNTENLIQAVDSDDTTLSQAAENTLRSRFDNFTGSLDNLIAYAKQAPAAGVAAVINEIQKDDPKQQVVSEKVESTVAGTSEKVATTMQVVRDVPTSTPAVKEDAMSEALAHRSTEQDIASYKQAVESGVIMAAPFFDKDAAARTKSILEEGRKTNFQGFTIKAEAFAENRDTLLKGKMIQMQPTKALAPSIAA